MPEMDGTELLEVLKGDPALAHIPVIMISAVDDLDTVVRCLELGADDYLTKAFKPVILRARMRAALDRKRLLDAEHRYAESMARELSMGRQIQGNFLPESLPQPDGLELSAALHPARQVSGDFYDAFTLGESGTIVFTIGDVCDKGVGAALFMALFRSLIRASADPISGGAMHMVGQRRSVVRRSLESETPGSLLIRVAAFTNDYIARLHGRANMFATVFLGALTPGTGELDYVNAGHEPALMVTADGTVRELLPTGPAIGLLPDADFALGESRLHPGGRLVAFTDGVVEARSPAGEAFGAKRLEAALTGPAASASELVHAVLEALRTFTGGAEQHDDVTLLALTRSA
jgi:serine phosphatase RsbU (regulator of sigma subunit)